MIHKDYFKGKRIAVIGLGPHGEMVEDVKFLIKAGALVSVYDLRSEARLKNHLVFLRTIGLANYVCGSIPPDDLLDMDIIVLSHEYPRESSFLDVVKSKGKSISVEYPETLFLKHSPPVVLVGIIGAFGKSTLLSMLKPLLELACKKNGDQNLFVIDQESDGGILSHLKKIKSGDILLFSISGMMMAEIYSLRISPHVAVFASLPDEVAYSDSPFEILQYQTYNNYIVASDEIVDMTHSLQVQPKAKMLRTKALVVDFGERIHLSEYFALAIQTASLFRIEKDVALEILSKWKNLKGRIELIKKNKNLLFYNDSASVKPNSTELALKTLSQQRNVILIMGGAKSNGSYSLLYQILPEYVHTIVLLPGSGTIWERRSIEKIINIKIKSAPTIEEAVRISIENANKGDIVLFSPGFNCGGVDVSRKDRGERFIRAVRACS